jgi:acyl dehydratase
MTEVREVETAPNLLALYGKAVVTGLRGGEGLPDTERVWRGVAVDRDHLATYARVCGFPLRERLPATYLHVVAFPLAIDIMASPAFPFPLPGMVHVANRITQLRPLTTGDAVDLRVRTQDLRPHPKGRKLDVLAEASIDGEPVWTDVSTYLRLGGGDPDADAGPDLSSPEPHDGDARWRVDAGVGRRYAAVSGDRNPIHLHPLSARLLGFPRAIAHGMWTAARALAAVEGRLADAFTYDVAFKRPLLLPSTVRFSVAVDDERVALGVRGRDGAPHLVGAVTPHGG